MPDTPDPDPVDRTDPDVLRLEVLRLRDQAMGSDARNEVLADRVAELEAQVEQLGADNEALHAELARHPMMRLAHAVRRRIRRAP